MELKQVKELMAAMEKAGIKKLSIKEKTGYEISLEREVEQEIIHPSSSGSSAMFTHPSFRHHEHHTAHFPVHHQHIPSPVPSEGKIDGLMKSEQVDGKFITSPMVGTFYKTPSPEDPVFVKVGDKVEENTIVCIIEAMKVMNEVKAGVSGVIAEICLDNAHPVEFGSKLFRIV
ncbi:MAG: acetyl-CoA carboxylase biotin carboxyl carrier protein [Chlamydiae bacterium]|nr:acetyl-CoA carboxylase biotin carboxyl carrier protein [Chlamydiota bacterium]